MCKQRSHVSLFESGSRSIRLDTNYLLQKISAFFYVTESSSCLAILRNIQVPRRTGCKLQRWCIVKGGRRVSGFVLKKRSTEGFKETAEMSFFLFMYILLLVISNCCFYPKKTPAKPPPALVGCFVFAFLIYMSHSWLCFCQNLDEGVPDWDVQSLARICRAGLKGTDWGFSLFWCRLRGPKARRCGLTCSVTVRMDCVNCWAADSRSKWPVLQFATTSLSF